MTTFRRDDRLRSRLYPKSAKRHPAKMVLPWVVQLVEKYTRPGDLILDPFGGIGSTLMATLVGRHVGLVELEPHFVGPAMES